MFRKSILHFEIVNIQSDINVKIFRKEMHKDLAHLLLGIAAKQ